jgi:hypothetical protein
VAKVTDNIRTNAQILSGRAINRLGAAISKSQAFANSPMGTSGATTAPGAIAIQRAQAMAGPGNTPGMLAQLLARDPAAFGGGLGPAYPMRPMPLDAVDPKTGRADPRKWQYEVAWNLDLQQRLAQWNILSSASVQIDIFAKAIAIRTADVVKMSGSWQVSQFAINEIMEANNCSSSEASKIAREQNIEQINSLTEMWENPYPQSDRTWEEWITEALWQVLTYDGLAIHPRFNLGGQVIGFEIIEASTIKCYLDNEGGIPYPPNPAYGQILYGFPRGEFIATGEKGDKSFLGGEFNIDARDQLSYFVMNRRTNSPYGLSPVEMALQIGNVYVERLKWLQAEYTYGSTARGYFETDTNEISQQNFTSWQRILNDWLSGQTSTRQLMTTLPAGWKAPVFTPQIDEKFKADFDEMLIKRVAGHFGVMPSQFGVIARAGLGGGKGSSEGAQDEAEMNSAKPQNKRLEGFITSLARRYQNCPRSIVYKLTDDEGSEDRLEAAKAHQVYFDIGGLTMNEIRRDLGQPDYEFPEADIPMIVTATGPVLMNQILANAQAAQTNAAAIAQGGNNGNNGEDTSGPGDNGQGSRQEVGEGEEGSGGEGQSTGSSQGEGGPTSSGVKASQTDEIKDFTKYVRNRVKRGNWRSFEFGTLSETEAEKLNESAYFMAKGVNPVPENLFGHFMSEVGRLSADIPKAKNQHNLPHVIRVVAKHRQALEDGLSAMTGVAGAIAAAMGGQAVATAVTSNIAFPSMTLQTTLTAIYNDAAQAATGEVSSEPVTSAGLRLQGLLARVPASIKGLEDTTISRVETAVANGVSLGESATEIAQRVKDSALGTMTENQASIVAMTEANRGYAAGYLDAVSSAGISQVNWVTENGACDICQSLEDASPYDIASAPAMPAHPNCQCCWESVL